MYPAVPVESELEGGTEARPREWCVGAAAVGPPTPPNAAVSRCQPLSAAPRRRPIPPAVAHAPLLLPGVGYRGVVQQSCPPSCPLYTPPLYLPLSPAALKPSLLSPFLPLAAISCMVARRHWLLQGSEQGVDWAGRVETLVSNELVPPRSKTPLIGPRVGSPAPRTRRSPRIGFPLTRTAPPRPRLALIGLPLGGDAHIPRAPPTNRHANR